MDIGATREELGDFLPGLPSSSWEMLPKALHTPSSISTTQGDVLISAAFPTVQWQAAALLPCQDLYTHFQPSSHPPQTFLVGSPFLICIFGQLFSHLSWIPCVQHLFWAHVLCSPRCFRVDARSPTGYFKCKAMSEMGVFCHSIPQHGPLVCKTAEALNIQKQADTRAATDTNSRLLTEKAAPN